MSLTAGARLGDYEILSPLGAGGMGEVYRAKDGRLALALPQFQPALRGSLHDVDPRQPRVMGH